jgi:hypothetical protein
VLSSRIPRQYSITSFTRLLRKIIHLFSADPEESLPAEFMKTLQPGLFSFKEAKAGSLLLSQKLLQRYRLAVGIAEVQCVWRLTVGLAAEVSVITI